MGYLLNVLKIRITEGNWIVIYLVDSIIHLSDSWGQSIEINLHLAVSLDRHCIKESLPCNNQVIGQKGP